MYKFVAGLDLGVAQDFSALTIMRREVAVDVEGEVLRNHRGRTLYDFKCVHIERYYLGMSYTSIVDSVKEIMGRPELHPMGITGGPNDLKNGPRLAIDATGVGRAVVDMFIAAGMPCRITPVTITGGLSEPRNQRWNADGGPMAWWCPKTHLVSVVQATLQGRRLKVSQKLKHAELLKKELFNFQVKVTAAANETFNARDGVHDDLVLAAALAIWLGAEDFVRNYAMSGAIEVPKAPRAVPGASLGMSGTKVDPHVQWNRTGPNSKRTGATQAAILDSAFRRERPGSFTAANNNSNGAFLMALAYEYHRVTCEHAHACAELNRLGADGWQLIPSTVVVASGTHPTQDRRVESFTGLMERAREQSVVKAEKEKAKADLEAKEKAAADKAKADAAKAALEKAAAAAKMVQTAAVVPGVPVSNPTGAKP